jgi:hypothetical protein
MGREILGKPLWEIIAWIILLLIIFWGIKQEYKASKCFDGRDSCGDEWDWEPQKGDDVQTLIRRIEQGNRAEGHIIGRRLTMISAAGIAILISWFYKKKQVIPDIVPFIVTFVLLMGTIWFTLRYHESHFLAEITRRTDLSIQELKYQTGVALRPKTN